MKRSHGNRRGRVLPETACPIIFSIKRTREEAKKEKESQILGRFNRQVCVRQGRNMSGGSGENVQILRSSLHWRENTCAHSRFPSLNGGFFIAAYQGNFSPECKKFGYHMQPHSAPWITTIGYISP